MIEPKLTLFKMQVKYTWDHATETKQARLSTPPEAFDSVDVIRAFGKFILAMINREMLTVTNINQTIIATPAVRVDDAFEFHSAANNRL